MKLFDKHFVNQTFLSLCLVLCCIGANATTSAVSSPMNGAMNVAPTGLAITAKVVAGITIYKIDISTDASFITNFQTHSDSNVQVFNNLSYGTKYYARVSTDGGTTYGMTTYFTTAQPMLSSPMSAATNIAPTSTSLTSKTVPGAGSYTIDLSTSNTFTSIFQTHTGASATQVFTNLGYGKKYFARVKTNLAGYGYGPVTNFTTAALVVTSPKNIAVGVGPKFVEIVSKPVSGANYYTIEVSSSSTFSSIFQTHTGISSEQLFTDLGYGKKYYTRVKTDLISFDSASQYGGVTYFTTASPDVTSPSKGAVGIGPKSVTIACKTVPDASSYTIEISLSSTFSPIVQTHTGSSSQVFTDLAYGKKYYTRVRTNLLKNDSTNLGYGATSYFTTASPDVTSPAYNAMGVSTSVLITSKTVPGASSYTIEVSKDMMFTNVMISTGTNSQPFNLEASKKYYVRVKTDLMKNDSSSFGYGKTSYFTTGLPAAPVSDPNIFSAKQSSADNELSVYPNPSTSTFRILVNSKEQESMVVNIYDSFGNQIHSSSQSTNSLIELGHDLKGGTYLLKISTSSGAKSVRVVKE